MLFYFENKSTKNSEIYKLFGQLIEKGQSTELLASIQEKTQSGRANLILDLSELKYINSTGINVFVNLLSKVRKEGGELAIFGMNKKINDLLVITKINSLFKIFETEEESVNYFISN
jgi:anti-sigma B factor antagonist